jgi:hypothetical protein
VTFLLESFDGGTELTLIHKRFPDEEAQVSRGRLERRRRLPMAVVAERAFTSRSTLQRVEAGDTSVSIGILCWRNAGAQAPGGLGQRR